MLDSLVCSDTLKSIEFNYVYNNNKIDGGYKIVVFKNNCSIMFIVSQVGKINPRCRILEVWENINKIKMLFSDNYLSKQLVYLDLLAELGMNRDYIYQWNVKFNNKDHFEENLTMPEYGIMDDCVKLKLIQYSKERVQLFNDTKLNNNQKIEIFTWSLVKNYIDDTQMNNLIKYFTISMRKFSSSGKMFKGLLNRQH